MSSASRPGTSEFAAFVTDVEPSLRQALIATYGAVDGREATVDALSWAWEHWDQLAAATNKTGYLYRVGQTATRKFATRDLTLLGDPDDDRRNDGLPPEFEPNLVPALRGLSDQQRTAVLLVHGYQWSQTEVAELLDITPSTVREHLRRGLDRLRTQLEVHDAY